MLLFKNSISVIFLLFWSFKISSQVDTLYVCDQGESVQLNAPAGFYAYRWTPDIGLDNPTSSNPIATVFQSNTFIAEIITKVNGENLISNAGFEDGNNSFSTEYVFSESIFTQGLYGISTSAAILNSTYFSDCPSRVTDTGEMMIIDGYPESEVKVWCQTVPVIPFQKYAFSVWLTSVNPDNPAKLQFFINGNTIGNSFRAGSEVCEWRQFYEVWTALDTTEAEICIINQNIDRNGNDFALDDFALVELDELLYDTTVVIIQSFDAAKERRAYFPNAFTPNFDGVNDIYLPSFGKGVRALREFKIYNRWGGLVFSKNNCSSMDLSCGWNGNVGGVPSNPGIYIYRAEVLFSDQQSEVFRGEINLIR